MDREKLLALNAEGLIPGPNETAESFAERVEATQKFFRDQKDVFPPAVWDWPREQLKTLFDFSPRWCAASGSSKGLTPWQAAATWIDVKRIYLIRVRSSGWLSRLVDRSEVLAHEAVHASRAAFDEPKYEEFFAYLTSSSRWRKVMGPLFRKSIEALLLMGLLGMGVMAQILEVVYDAEFFSCGWFFLALFLCFGWSLRLMRSRIQIEKAARRLAMLVKDPKMIRPALFRMTDQEIDRLASHLPFEPGHDLRWCVIKTAYWKEKHDAAH